MIYGICNLSIVPIRKEPSDKSEMVTQLLFGEHFEIIERHKQWRRILTAYDHYDGWADEKQISSLASEDFNKLNKTASFITTDLLQVFSSGADLFPVVLGSALPFFNGKHFRIAGNEYGYEGRVTNCDKPSAKKMIAEYAMMYLNAPYLWGGRSPFGIDCSGLTQMAYKLSGVKLKRDAHQQAEQGYTLNLLGEAEPGDLVFFDNEEGKIVHTGIVLSEGSIIHASGKVRIDKLDHQGIYNMDTKRYSHNMRLIKRVL